ncbi:MAG: biotin--[acetyl-CoA-carboxylase] ligase [Gammaproteobacteria bacterium]
MADPRNALLALLADGAWHTGVQLGANLGLSRAAIWKQVRVLRTTGLEVVADRRRGYRLGTPLQLLDADAIRAFLDRQANTALAGFEVLLITGSTSERLASVAAPAPGRMLACAAEYQSGGRGRRGRRWFSPLGHGLCLSVSWCYEEAPRDLAALGLVVGVAVAEAVSQLVPDEAVQLKWPNDVVADGGKLGGILVDVAGETGGPLRIVIGIGLNVCGSPQLAAEVDADGGNLRPVALDALVKGRNVSRNQLAGYLLNALYRNLTEFADSGFATFAPRWRRRDCLLGETISISSGSQTLSGVASGITDDGALLIAVDGRLTAVFSGDVSLRRPT